MSKDSSNSNQCSTCGKPRRENTSGSLTQWMLDPSSCSCQRIEIGEGVTAEELERCDVCGKFIRQSRPGSMTQWIFGAEKCTCKNPVPRKFQTKVDIRPSVTKPQSMHEDRDEPELDLSAESFPRDRYKPIREIGKGAAGLVYLCRDRLLGVKVAVKTLHLATSSLVVAFQNEAQVICKLEHPNIIRVFNLGATEGGVPYMVMEYVEGISLQEYLAKHGPLSIKECGEICVKICEGLSHAHKRGVFHRDIKSSNILLSKTGKTEMGVRIIDFGISLFKNATVTPNVVQGHTVVGTPAYMPPDQAMGLPYDERSEIYALGCLMFEALTGRMPFEGESSLETISMHVQKEPPRLCDASPDREFPETIERVIACCLQKDPQMRYQSMEHLQDSVSYHFLGEHKEPEVKRENTTSLSRFRIAAFVGIVLLVGIAVANQFPKEAKKISKKGNEVRRQIENERIYTIEGKTKWKGKPDDRDADLEPLFGTKIRVVDLTNNKITSKSIEKLSTMPIEELNLFGVPIDDSSAPYLGRMKTLRTLFLTETKMTGKSIPELATLNLKRVDVEEMKGLDDECFGKMVQQWPNLRSLNVSDTSISPKGLLKLGQLKKLVDLEIADMTLTDEVMEVICSKPLVDLNVLGSTISKKWIDRMPSMKTLKRFRVSHNPGWTIKDYLAVQEKMPWCRVECNEMVGHETNVGNAADLFRGADF